ncbi:SusF/SusE family outer membrane protein [Chryseobacterium sp. G0162]|uniref:SusF/SusE family outer membrane protein n=1 Tax=unclassified Chryseobacterium TaxID=2593645 RepID=UPI000F4FB370|nr:MULTISPECIES: SusF/SusE family outer membrane protein [unclassified Chryseobacterium]AZB07917.1 SusF/SusE family outer membrane protein [Chryseobacterium sp. G0162]
MKHFFKIFTIAILGMLVASCKDEDQAILNETAQSKISSDKTTIVLDKTHLDDTAVNFTWAKSTFDLAVVSAPKIEIGLKGNNFKDGKSLDVVTSPYSMTNKQLNTLLLSLGATPNEVNQVEVRVKTVVGTASFYSNVITLAVTPYILGPIYNYTDLYLIGDATAAVWDNSATNAKLYPLQKTATAGVYSYTGYFAAGGFKLIQTPGSWDNQYGLGASAGALLAGGGSSNIPVATAGYYKLTVDVNASKYTLTSMGDPTIVYTTISMIGSASGDWSTDVDMEKSTFDPHIWVKKNVNLSSGEFKFRANHDWGTNWGVAKEFFGVADLGGGNIPVSEAFKYDVYFNDITAEFSVIPVY